MYFLPQGDLLAIGTHKGCVEVWDVESRTRLVTMDGHSMRVSTLAWNGQQLSSGSRDRVILQRDIRSHSLSTPDRKLTGHRQEVNISTTVKVCYTTHESWLVNFALQKINPLVLHVHVLFIFNLLNLLKICQFFLPTNHYNKHEIIFIFQCALDIYLSASYL